MTVTLTEPSVAWPDDVNEYPSGSLELVRRELRDSRNCRTHGAVTPVCLCRSRDHRPRLGQEAVHLGFRQPVPAKAGGQRNQRIQSSRFKADRHELPPTYPLTQPVDRMIREHGLGVVREGLAGSCRASGPTRHRRDPIPG